MSNFHKQFLVHTKYNEFVKEVMNIYFIYFYIKTETAVPDSESGVLVLK